jgi:hypothetical protein
MDPAALRDESHPILPRKIQSEELSPCLSVTVPKASLRVVPEHFPHGFGTERLPGQYLVGGLGKPGFGVGVVGPVHQHAVAEEVGDYTFAIFLSSWITRLAKKRLLVLYLCDSTSQMQVGTSVILTG